MEYGAALRYLDELLKQLKPEELQAVDSLIRERAEFGIYTNLAQRVQAAPSSLIPVSSASQSNGDSRGLSWVMALARVEVGGVMATFSAHPAPFEAVIPSEYEMPAYRQLLLDGAQTHFWALANDPEIRRIAKMEPNTQTLAYIRRLNVARHFLFAAIRGLGSELNAVQMAEAMTQKDQLEQLLRQYSQNLTNYMVVMNLSRQQSSQSRSDRSTLEACGIQLQNEPRALASGTAKIETRETK